MKGSPRRQTGMGTGRAKVGVVCQHKGEHLGVCLSAKCCCCGSGLSLEYRAAWKNFCRLVACERWGCSDLSVYKQGKVTLVSETSFWPVVVRCCDARWVPTCCKSFILKPLLFLPIGIRSSWPRTPVAASRAEREAAFTAKTTFYSVF